eukprot:jgi/Psemu1/306506/fgenesh1_kg.261_\
MMINTAFPHTDTTFPTKFSPIAVTRALPPKKHVSFFPRVFVNRSLQRSDFTATELQAAWYSMDELKMIKRSCRRLAIQLTNKMTDEDDQNTCFRGLEGRTIEGAKGRKLIKLTARNAVLLEQYRQRERGAIDQNRLANECFEHTEKSSSAAHMVALRDQKEAMAIHNETVTAPVVATTASTSGTNLRRKAMDMYTRSDSMRSLKRLASFSSTRRLISDAVFKV